MLKTLLSCALFLGASHANEVMSWVPPYGIGNCKNSLNGTYGKYKAKDGLTHIGLQFWYPTNSGGVTFAGPGPDDVKWFTDWGKANGVKVLLTVFNATGGWNWPLAVSAFSNNRSAFAKALVAEMDKYGLDGIDLDLEGNKLPKDANRQEYKAFVTELSGLLKPKSRLLTICTFNNENADNMPDETWFADWLGKVDYIHIMGYEEMYEKSPDKTQAYSYQQNLGAKAGFARHQVSMGLMGSQSWGGGTALDHVNECITKPVEIASVCVWDLQFPGAIWKTEGMWEALAKIKAAVPITTALGRPAHGASARTKLPMLKVSGGRVEFIPGTQSASLDAAGRHYALP